MRHPVVQVPPDPFDDAPTQVMEEGEEAETRVVELAAATPAQGVPRVPPVLGHYRLGSPIAFGGMGLVYEAVHVHLGRRVAIKMIRPGLEGSPDVIRRFLQEAIAATRIGHPGVVGVYDYGYSSAGEAYLAMELLEGESLAARIAAGPLAIDEILAIGRDIADAMSAAHRAGIVHRDLKPDNVFLARDPTSPRGIRVKVLDFGVAKSVAGSMISAIRTGLGHILGTPLYMAPEQAIGADRIDQRTDVYALGCVLYQMACRRPPFVGDAVDVLVAHRLNTPPPVRTFNPAVPATLDALFTRMLAKDPDDRPSSMEEVAAELESIANPVAAPLAVLPHRERPRPAAAAHDPTVLSRAAPRGRRSTSRIPRALLALLLAAGLACGLYLAA